MRNDTGPCGYTGRRGHEPLPLLDTTVPPEEVETSDWPCIKPEGNREGLHAPDPTPPHPK